MKSLKTDSKYNYREEWARFVSTLSADDDETDDSLAARIVKAVGAVIGATGGALWLHEAGTSFRLMAKQNFSRDECRSGDAPVLAVWLVTHEHILDLANGEHHESKVDLPEWLPAPPSSELILPLHHRGWLIGFMVLRRGSGMPLDREDRMLLKVVARDAASYLAEDDSTRQLRDGQAFDAFSRRFAFVMHDLKNMSAQLALTLSNAKRHKDNPEFVADMIKTVDASVDRMNGLIGRLRGEEDDDFEHLDLERLIQQILEDRKDQPIRLGRPLRQLQVLGEPKRLRTAIEHILDNALQSKPSGAKVTLTLRAVADDVRIEVADDGLGMDPKFIEERLFTPFKTTKAAGFGLGMTETREIIEQAKGHIMIESEPGAGTTITLCLPRRIMETS